MMNLQYCTYNSTESKLLYVFHEIFNCVILHKIGDIRLHMRLHGFRHCNKDKLIKKYKHFKMYTDICRMDRLRNVQYAQIEQYKNYYTVCTHWTAPREVTELHYE